MYIPAVSNILLVVIHWVYFFMRAKSNNTDSNIKVEITKYNNKAGFLSHYK